MTGKTSVMRSWGWAATRIAPGSKSRRKTRHLVRPGLLALEERRLLTPFMVMDNSDDPSDTGSLRYGLSHATSGTDITFAPNVTGTITLTHGLLDINQNVTITGPSTGQLAISGNKKSRIFSIESGATATISLLTITNGKESDDYGGGLYNRGTLIMNACTVSNNVAGDKYGGGVYNIHGTVTLTNCTFYNNSSSSYGGGVYNQGTANVTNCTFYDNVADYEGGGIYNDSTAKLVACTLTNNSVPASGKGYGGGLYNNGTVSMIDTLLAGNTVPDAYSGGNVYGYVASQGHNLISNTEGSSGWISSDVQNKPANLASINYYGGPTQTFALSPGSPALGAGGPASYAGTSTPLTTDQRGLPLDSPKPDIGAFQLAPLLVNTTADGVSSAQGVLTLKTALNVANLLGGAQTIGFDPKVFATPRRSVWRARSTSPAPAARRH